MVNLISLLQVKPVGNYWRLPTGATGDAHYDASKCRTKIFRAVLCSHFNEEMSSSFKIGFMIRPVCPVITNRMKTNPMGVSQNGSASFQT